MTLFMRGCVASLCVGFLGVAALPSQARPHRCGTPAHVLGRAVPEISPDCGYNSTSPGTRYAPTFIYLIPVVVHILQNNAGKGAITNAMVRSQIDILNEDFRALKGTPGAKGFDAMIRFHLATQDLAASRLPGSPAARTTAGFATGGATGTPWHGTPIDT